METNLLIYDMELFLDKYTRFMTKNIYITHKMYQRFLEQYRYLYQKLESDQFLYQDNSKFRRVMNILKNQNQLIKLHNKKYLQTALKDYQSFFDSCYPKDKLDVRKRSIILSLEEELLTIQPHHSVPLIVGKLQFLLLKKEYLPEKILLLTETPEQAEELKMECFKQNIDVEIYDTKSYGHLLLESEEEILEYHHQYDILSQYLIYQLFPKKDLFKKFYQAFSQYIYLNKDYQEYETFIDYHNYMYKRKFLASNLSLKKFNEQEVQKRKNYLRTIQNETMKQNEEVDIANFLYLNSCHYRYDRNEGVFYIELDEKKNCIRFLNGVEPFGEKKNTSVDYTIYLYSSYHDERTYLEVLVYELIKRRYPLEKRSDDELYSQLKNTTISNYFSEFIHKYFIPTIDYYLENQSLEDTRLTRKQQEEFMYLYQNYEQEVKKHHYISEKEVLSRIEQDIVRKKYQYLFLIGDIPISCNIPTFTVLSKYQEVELLNENIKLLYDYKKYLCANQYLPIAHTYLNRKEIQSLTTAFLKENLSIINKGFGETNKEVQLYFYNDMNRLHVYRNISECCAEILEHDGENALLAFRELKDMNILIGNDLFFKVDKNTLLTKLKVKVACEEILKISKLYPCIILPYLFVDSYHEDFLKKDYHYYLKVMLYVVLNKCRQKLILVCPSSRKVEIKQLLKDLNNLVIYE